MDSFKIFFERRARNPLRKKELEGTLTNQELVERESENLPDEEKEKLQKMKQYKVEPERIEAFRQGKLKEHEKNLKQRYLRTKIEKPELLFNIRGFKVFKDIYVTEDIKKGSKKYNDLVKNINTILREYKDILPNRKPKIVVTNTEKNPNTTGVNLRGTSESPAGAYHDRLIYINEEYVGNLKVLIHEYAHYLSDRIPNQVEPLLQEEYRKMLQSYFGQRTKKENLEGGGINKRYRTAIANKLGLPTEYSASNFDEWFAELITHWKNMPNNKNTYGFKKILKKVLSRI